MARRKITLLYDPKKGEFYFNGVSSLIDVKADIVRFQHGVEKIIGPAARGIIYNASKAFSIRRYMLAHDYMSRKNENLSHREFIVHCLEEFKRSGRGVAEIVEYDRDSMAFRVKVKNSYNTIGYGKERAPVCYITSGEIGAIFEAAFGMEMGCTETDCAAAGSKSCIFSIRATGGKSPEGLTSDDDRFLLKSGRGLKKMDLEYDERGNVFIRGNSSAITFREYWSAFQKEFEKIIGPAARGIAYEVSRQGAVDAMDSIMKYVVKFVRMVSIKKIADKVMEEIPMRGYGVVSGFRMDAKKKTAVLRMRNCFNAVGYNGKAKKPVCYSMAGNIAGVSQIIFGTDMVCRETKCEGRGDKYCEFVVRPA